MMKGCYIFMDVGAMKKASPELCSGKAFSTTFFVKAIAI